MSVSNSLVFANARIKSLENNLLTSDKIIRMVDSNSLEEAVKILAESNYGGGVSIDNPKLFEEILFAEENNVTNLIRSLIPYGYGVECFLLRNDYHNAKALVKTKLSNITHLDTMLKPYGTMEIEKLKESIMSENYAILPSIMQKALEEIDKAWVNNEQSPRKIDIIFDKAMFEDIFENLKKIKGNIHDYFIKLADLTNIAAMTRTKRAELGIKAFEESFIEGGILDLQKLRSVYDLTLESIADAMRYSEYKDAFFKLVEDKDSALVKFEIYMDNLLLSIFKVQKHDMFTPTPIVGYYLGKLTEIKMAKLILVCINNNVDKSIIRQRLRELYA